MTGRPSRARRALALAGLAFSAVAAPGRARADVPFADRPLVLPPLRSAVDLGAGVGQTESIELVPGPQGYTAVGAGTRAGVGVSLDAQVGLPIVGQLGVHLAYRFPGGEDAGADYYGRIFDPVVNGAGPEAFANPEVSLRTPLLSLARVEVAIEGRVVVPDSSDSTWLVVPGIPVRIHFPSIRIDTGLYLPLASSGYSVQVPVELFFQWGRDGEWFAGPLAGLLFSSGSDPNPALMAGVGGGRTFGGALDVKAQVLTTQLNDTNWAKYVGAGVGVGLRVP